MHHMREECEAQLKCGGCDFKIYTKYYKLGATGTSSDQRIPEMARGHNCVRDNAQSDKLLVSLRQMQRQAKSSVNTQLKTSEAELRRELKEVQDELVLYKGPIPDVCKPTLNDMNLITLQYEKNAPEGMAYRCKQWIIESILCKGFTDDAMILII